MGGAELLRGLVQKAFDLEGLRRQFLRTHHVQLCLVERSLADTDVTIGVPHMGSMTSRGREPVFVSILRQWVPLAVLGTVLCALVGAAVQPVLRGLANDPQIEMAEDAAAALERGQVPQTLLPAAQVDIATSLAPFLLIFDESGRPVASSARLDGETPKPPSGVFAHSGDPGGERFTWQPRPGVRSAAVLVRFGGPRPGYVLAGRSLREVEIRESGLNLVLVLAWAASVGGSLIAVVLVELGSRHWWSD